MAESKLQTAVGSMGVEITNIDDMRRVAEIAIATQISNFSKAEDAFLVIQAAMERRIPWGAALQHMTVINGRLCSEANLMRGQILSSGLCTDIQEWVEGEDKDRVARCRTTRKGLATPIETSFSVSDALTAGLWGRGGWSKYPEDMLAARALSRNVRRGWFDVALGCYLPEEIPAEEPREVTPEPPANELDALTDQLELTLNQPEPKTEETA